MNVIRFAQKTDVLFGIAFAIISAYSVYTGSWVMAAVWALSSVVSFVSAKYSPARWLAKRMLMTRLKV